MKIAYILLICTHHIVRNAAQEKGPYNAVLLSVVGNCSKTYLPMLGAKERADWFIEAYKTSNHSYVRGNVTFKRYRSNLKLSAEQYYLENGDWRLTSRLPGFSCQRGIVRLIAKLANVEVNFAECGIPKGTYKFNRLNVNYVLKTWLPTNEYGRTMVRMLLINSKVTICCGEFQLDILRA